MRYPEFEAMIRPARLYREFWRFLLGLLVVAFVYVGGIAVLLLALFAIARPMDFPALLQQIAEPTTPGPALILLASFAAMLLGPILAAAACHFRGPGTLFGPWSELRRGFLIALAVTLPIYGIVLFVGLNLGDVGENLGWAEWVGWLPWALPLLLLQITAEEVLFRGYIQQQLAARFAARWVWMVLPALIFAAGHWTPQAGAAAWLTVAATFLFGLIAADLTARTGSLGAAMGLHFVNNVSSLLVISSPGSITGLSRWVTAFGLGENGTSYVALCLDIVMLILVWRLLVRVLDR